MRNVLLLVGVSVLLSGCVTPDVHLSEGRALSALWTSLDATAKVLDPLVKAGVTSKAENLVIAENADKVVAALNAATTAYHIGDNSSAEAQVQAATTLLASLTEIATAKGAK